jgi:hypothetical protein
MALPAPYEKLWSQLESVRADVLREAHGLTQAQADWKPAPEEWSVGEILDHLAVVEVSFGKLSSKLLRDAGERPAPYPADLASFAPLPPFPPGPRIAPQGVWPSGGKPVADLVSTLGAVRARSRETLERVGSVDPRPLRWKHPAGIELDLSQVWQMQAAHDGDHLQQIRGVKASAGFPRA